MSRTDWNPELYSRFAGLRLRPALDLLAQVGTLPDGPVCDLGCGTGVVGPMLKTRFPDRELTGMDSSTAMLKKADETGAYDTLEKADIANWSPEDNFALIFSNAALHWLDDHESVLEQLVRYLRPGGTLAVQVPNQNRAPSHRIWLDLVGEHFPGRVKPETIPGVMERGEYFHTLAPFGAVDLWETEYFQRLPASDEGHPVRHFTSSTFARPVLDRLDEGETVMIEKLYDEVMEKAYPRQPDGSVIFPFRRLFFKLEKS
ncbi:trans-aconitate methyltransferase [Oceanicola sp. 22II-s10i]|uniref:methyltransferase domain-containing protein n=1 Tax=Oceanicola sp. 22II-s10i TaxID=1317116 RepID=UPI000B528E80|nr:methyltransferase domain-containing protein [Oceanicola sp. 22II-s10i]OWU85471.1 trans-aconitate methyltransferase [Oceanicola sp. 22II-s10i]